ncbi:uncharacterized protein KGF55_002488 [Candida pseudojiufengensis]|uniref:uncharacterized protein n=1 Tax=Candida pseudojiufengensis TaxID=497109 RepID=UPI0022254B32|nr:uncharacterized protein KGF55_002488 [Candida pseudojiufengensis]KAI5963608.1 hypothetical protein KGF55_002488 [Candida pseudojiufengensis]
MYSSSDPFPKGLHHLWSKHNLPNDSTQIAPALSSFTADFPGPNLSEVNNSNDLSLLLKVKQQQLDNIRLTGYSIIRPIGITKTMAEIDYLKEQNSNIVNDESYNNISEAAENSRIEEAETLPLQQDLDAQILNADETLNSEDFEEDENSISDEPSFQARQNLHIQNVDEGFMAADVEYQDDHSLNSETNTNILMNSGATTGLITQRTATTNPTTATSLRTVEERYVDENDYSEQDMLVD